MRERIVAFDYLRALAITGILLCHFVIIIIQFHFRTLFRRCLCNIVYRNVWYAIWYYRNLLCRIIYIN